MDPEDPIQQLLKNTGWSCDDLLEKLQKYKGQKEPTKADDKDSVDSDEGIVDSTGEVNNYDIPKVQNLKPEETIDKTKEVYNEKTSEKTNNRIASEEFSDTDEEEVEVNVTNSNIINEIIDEISTAETEETRDRNDNVNYQAEVNRDDEATEVTEVRVIQVNSDDEDDDCFIEENSQNVANPDEIISKFDYLETYPRNISTILSQPLTNELNCNEETKPDEEDINKQKTLFSNEKKTKKDHAVDCEVLDESVATVESDSVCSEKKLTTKEEPALQELDAKTNNETHVEDAAKDFAQTHKEAIGTKINLPHLDIKRNNKDCENVEETPPSGSLRDMQDNSKLELKCLNTHREVKSSTENIIDPSDATIKKTDEKSTSENLGKPPRETEITEKNIDFSSAGVTRNETYDVDDDDESSSTNVEDIRNNLKLQLNCLRTRKKGHFLQELRSRVADVKEYNKKIVNSCEKEDSSITSVDNVDKSNGTECEDLESKAPSSSNDGLNTGSDILNDELYTQTNEFGLVILNVQGGIDIDECDDESGTGFNDSNSSQNDVENEPNNGVLDEIRKIIRKQKVNTLKQNKEPEMIFNSTEPKKTIDNFVFFSGSLEHEAAEEKAKGINADISADNSSSSFNVEDQTIDKNSPFVSNTLDEFLTGNSKLNISYNVPKCEAEDGLIESYHEESPLLLKKVVKLDKERSPKPKKTKIIKAKTLAQKRKMLEKQRRRQMKNIKPRMEQPINHDVKLESPENTVGKNDSYIMINDKKIWVKGTTPATCITKINTKKTVSDRVETTTKTTTSQPQRKPSLLTDLVKKVKEQIEYRPGPLCKKAELQISGQDNWKTETKTLPKILLEVTPKIGQPISPSILGRLPQSDGKLKDNQVEFALSVLKTRANADKPKTFIFPLRYRKNQENILVRKQKLSPELSPVKYATTKSCNEQQSVESVVADVISDLITYVEIKDIAPTLIKDDDKIRDTVADDKFANMPLIADSVSNIFKKPQKKRSKIELELFRLSCKVVNVEVEENLTEETCSKPYCRLGCVCNSLKCDRLLTYHCGKVQCMLDCKCPKEKSLMYDKVTLPAGTDILSNDAVSRIEDEAKKDLAKVEREFTQTVIHTNDKTIVVGLGGRNKSKRTTKTPKKYSDYVDSIEVVKEIEKEKVVDKNDFFRKCVVSLQNLNLSGIVPYCLTHRLYNCHCNGMSLFKSDTSMSSEPIVIEDDEEVFKNKQTYPTRNNKNKTQLKHEKEQAKIQSEIEQNYDPKKYSKNKYSELRLAKARAETLKASVTELVKKKFVNIKPKPDDKEIIKGKSTAGLKKYKSKNPELEMFSYIKKIDEDKQNAGLKKCNSKILSLNPAETSEEDDNAEEQIRTPSPVTLKTLKVLRPVRKQEEEIVANKQLAPKKCGKKKTPCPKQTREESESSSVNSPTDLISSNGRPIRNTKKITLREDFSYSSEVSFYAPEDCARVRGIPRHVLNNYKSVVRRNKKPFLKHDFINNISDSDILKSKINNTQDTRQMLEVDLLKKHLIEESLRQKRAMTLLIENSYSDKSTHKRKQTLEVRSDEKVSFGQAIQRRKKSAQRSARIESVFDGEIIIDSRNMELLRKMGPKTVSDGYARLLPWKALTESFRDGTIKIWSMVNMPSRLLINKSDKLPPKNYINITQTANPTEVINWILRNQLPSSYRADHVSFILKQTKDHYEICGLCTKNFNEDILTSEASNKSVSEDESVEQIKDGLSPFPHKDLYGVSHLLYIKKEKFKLQELIEENLAAVGETSVEKNRLYMWAALPEVSRVGKWRVIFLNSDFTYLYFTKLKYSIKYTDLVSMANMAKSSNSTVMLRNPTIQQAYYTHENFGIYFDPHYQERVFIGPYSKVFSGDDIETLRYINKSLVCNESFHKMIGKTDYRCGHWLIERPYKRQQEPEQTIDLTRESSQTTGKRKQDSNTSENPKRLRRETSNKEQRVVITHNKEQIKVIDGTPRKPEDFNRYIITNIPHFGYLGAYKHDNSNEIDVSWPFENKLLRFPSVSSAIEFLQERFSSLLQPIPETFKINVIVLTQIDLENSQPVNASILSGHYICGDFGFYNVKYISNVDCVNIVGMTREELLRIFAKRAQAFVRKKIEELAELLNIEKSELGRYDIVNILDMAQKEINVLKEMEISNLATKNDLLLKKRDLAQKVISSITELPGKDQRWEQLKFRKALRRMTLNNEPKDKMEPIVIPDSDEEESASTSGAKDSISREEPQEKIDLISDLDSPEPKSVSLPVPEAHKVRTQGGHMVSVLYNNKNLPTKVTETASSFPQLRKLKLKSVLKPISNISTPTLSRVEPHSLLSKQSNTDLTKDGANQSVLDLKSVTPQFLTGVKIVKTSSGKFMLVSDKSNKNSFKMPETIKGTKIIIKNNKILSVKTIEADNKRCEQDISASQLPLKKLKICPSSIFKTVVSRSILDSAGSDDVKKLNESESAEKDTVAESSEVNSVEANDKGQGHKKVMASRSIPDETSSNDNLTGSDDVTKPCINESESAEKDTDAESSEVKSVEANDEVQGQEKVVASRSIPDATSSNDNLDTEPEPSDVQLIEAKNKGCEQGVFASEPPLKKVKIYPSPICKEDVADSVIDATASNDNVTDNEGVEKDKAADSNEVKSNESDDKSWEQSPSQSSANRSILDATSSDGNLDTEPESSDVQLIEANIKGEQGVFASESPLKKVKIYSSSICKEDVADSVLEATASNCNVADNKDVEKDKAADSNEMKSNESDDKGSEQSPSQSSANRSILDATSSDDNLDAAAEPSDVKSDNESCEQDISASEPTLETCPSQVSKKIVVSKSILDETCSNDSLDVAAETTEVKSIEADDKGCEPGICASESTSKRIKLSPPQSQKVARNRSSLDATDSDNNITKLCFNESESIEKDTAAEIS